MFMLITMVINYFNEYLAQGSLLSSLIADIDTIFTYGLTIFGLVLPPFSTDLVLSSILIWT